MPSKQYDPPWGPEEMREHGYSEEKIRELEKDPVHGWRMQTGLELIHREPTKTELMRIWANWQLMSDEQKAISDKKCKELFGCTNKELYDYLLPQYTTEAPGKDAVKYPPKDSSEALAEQAIKDGYLYHGSADYYPVLKPQTQEDVNGKKALSLSPYKSIASMFVIPMNQIKPKGYRRCTFRYEEWFSIKKNKYQPLTVTHIYHNVKQLGNFERTFTGYLYTVKAEDVLKDASDNPKWTSKNEVLTYVPEIKPVKVEKIQMKVIAEYNLQKAHVDHDAIAENDSAEAMKFVLAMDYHKTPGPITYNQAALQQIRSVIKYRSDEITDNTEDIEVASFDTHRLAYTAQMIYEFYVKLLELHNSNVRNTIRQYQEIYPELNCSAVNKYVENYKENLLTPEYIGAYAPYIVKDHLIMAEYENHIEELAHVYKLDDGYYEKYMEALEKKRRTEMISYPEHWQTPDDMPDYALYLYAIELFYSTVDLVRTNHPLKMDNNCAITDPKKRALVLDFISELNEEHYQHVSVEAVQAKEMLPDSVKNKLGKYLYHGTHRDLDIKQLAVHFCRNRANLEIKAPVVYMTRSLGLASLHCAEFMKGHASKMKNYREHFVELDKAKDSDQIFKHVEIVHNDPDLPEASGENDGFIYCTETEKCVDKLYFSTPKNKNDYLFVSYSPLPVDKKIKIHITWHRKYSEEFAKSVQTNQYAGVESLTYSLESDQVQESGNYYLIRGFPVVAFFRQLGKHYKTHKLENLIQIVRSIGITQWMANSRTVKIHRFFIPEILFLMEKFRMPVTLINSIRDGTWVGEKVEHKTDCKIERVKSNMTCTLFPHQEEFIKNYAEYKESHHLRGYLLSFDQGLGKTMTSVALMEALNKDRVVVICPKNTMVETWKSHFERFFKEKQSIFVIGVDKKFEGQRFCIFNYDALDKLNSIPGIKTDNMGVIVDECHNFLRMEASRTQKLIDLTKEFDKTDILLMSGTPIKAQPRELIPLISMVDPLFDEEAVRIFRDSFGVNTKIATEVLHARLKRMMERVTKEVLDLPPKYRSTIKVKLPDGNKYTIKVVKQGMREFINSRLAFHRDNMVLYRQEFDECMAFLKTTPIYQTEDFKKYKVIVERLIHDHGQYEHGDAEISWMNEYEKSVVEKQFNSELLHKFRHCKAAIKYLHLKVRGEVLGQFLARLRIEMTTKMLKTVDIKALINEAKKKTIIFTSYIDTIEACEQYVKSLGFKPIVIYGKNSGEIAPLAAKFQKDPQFNPLIASLQTLSTGATLTAANRVIFLNKPWRSVDYAQASDRVHRIGQDTAVDIISLVLDTGEEGNLSTRMEDIMDESARAFDAIVEERKEQSDKKKASNEWLLPADIEEELHDTTGVSTEWFIEELKKALVGRKPYHNLLDLIEAQKLTYQFITRCESGNSFGGLEKPTAQELEEESQARRLYTRILKSMKACSIDDDDKDMIRILSMSYYPVPFKPEQYSKFTKTLNRGSVTLSTAGVRQRKHLIGSRLRELKRELERATLMHDHSLMHLNFDMQHVNDRAYVENPLYTPAIKKILQMYIDHDNKAFNFYKKCSEYFIKEYKRELDYLDQQAPDLEPSDEGMELLDDTKEQRKLNKMARPHYRERGANSWEHVQQDIANGILLVKKLKHRDLTLQEYATILYHDCGCKSMYPEKEGHGLRGVEIAKPELKKCGFFSDKEIDEICTAILEHDETTNPKNMHSSELSDLLASADTNPPDIPWILNKSYVWGLRHGYSNHDKNIENVVEYMKKENGTKGSMNYPKLYSEYYKKEIKQMKEFFDNLTVEECAKIVDKYRKENELRHNELTLPEPDTDQKITFSDEGFSMEAAANIKAKRKKVQDYILSAMKLLDPHTDTNYKYWKNKFDSMSDKDFDKFMHYLREGKTNIHMFVPPFKVTLQTKELLDAAHKLGVKIMHRIWMHDPHTGIKYLTPEEYMVLQLPVRRQQQFLDEKLSVPDNDKTIDGLTGQVTGDSKSCSITNPEIQILHARNLDATLYELSNVRGGNIRNYAEFKRSLEETGEIKLNQLDPTNRTRVAVMGQVLLTAMHLDVNLVDI